MTSATARALDRFADAVVFLEFSRSQRDALDCAEACQEAEADNICRDALENLKTAKQELFEALDKENFEDQPGGVNDRAERICRVPCSAGNEANQGLLWFDREQNE